MLAYAFKTFLYDAGFKFSGGIMADYKDLKAKAKSIRKNILLMLNKAGSGHTGGSLGMADVFTVRIFEIR